MKKHLLLTVAVTSVLAASPSSAAPYIFDLTGAYTASFTIDSDLLGPPACSDADSFIVDDIAGTFEGLAGRADSIAFSVGSFSGGLNLQFGDDFVDLWGRQLFTGSTTAPTFSFGRFELAQEGDPTRQITLSISAVPEPGTWAMMAGGLAIVGWSMRRARVRVQVA